MLNAAFIKQVKELLASSDPIVILTHHNPDGDAIGASLALWHYLRKIGHKVDIVVPSDFPEFYKWMLGSETIKIATKEKEVCESLIANAKLIFCLDFNMPNRVGSLIDALEQTLAKIVLIDHHLSPSDFFTLAHSQADTSSTSELIFDFISCMGHEATIDNDIATAIYVGIITDTGSFSYNCDYTNTYTVTSKLFEHNIIGEKIHRLVYGTFSESRLRLLGYCLSEKLVVIPEYATAYITLTKEEMKRFDFMNGDNEGIVNYGLTIKGIKLAALFSERPNHVKLSLRSSGDLNVGIIAKMYFNGGGHKNASGADICLKMEETIAAFIKILPLYKEYLV
ncbi:MAG: bifunctional oligoribonuclease/PAP phosphatase NrnA [Bacteroidota bacterium]